jgi:hypothetical protein
MKEKILIVTAMRLGDCLHILPIASWLYKTTGLKIDWAIATSTPYISELIQILHHQSFTDHAFSYNYHSISPWNGPEVISCHRPYHHIEKEINDLYENKYSKMYCFGYSKSAYERREIGFFTSHFIDEYQDLGIDWGYVLNFGESDNKYSDAVVKIDKLYNPIIKDIEGVNLGEENTFIKNLQYCSSAKEVITTRTGMAIALSLARIPFKIKFLDGDWEWYKTLCHSITGGIERI